MASNTPNLNLYKKDPTVDGNDTFNIKTMLNDNWDKIDAAVTAKADKVDFASHLADFTSHVTAAERTTWNSKAEKTYVDEQIQTVTATGIPKLVSYEYDLYATIDNQTIFTIPYDYFNNATDTLIVEISGIDIPKSYYTVTNPITNGDGSITKGFITLTQGRPKDSFLKMRILKNVPIGPDGAISGRVLAINSIPQDRIENINKIVQTDTDGNIPLYKYKNRPNYLVNSSFNFGLQHWTKLTGVPTLGYFIGENGEGGLVVASVSNDGTDWFAYESKKVRVIGGNIAIISGDMYSGGITSGSMFIEVRGYDSLGNDLGNLGYVPAVNGQGWKRYWTKTTLPANVRHVAVRMCMDKNTVNTNCAWRRIKIEFAFAEETNVLPTPYSQEADIELASDSTKSSGTYYVDGVNGNDFNNGLNSGTGAFKTVNKALSVLPKNLKHDVHIQIANGTYNETMCIAGFKGNGKLYIWGHGSTLLNMYVQDCDCLVQLDNFILNTYKAYTENLDYCLGVFNSRNVHVMTINATVSDTVKKVLSGAIVVMDNSYANIYNSTLSNGRSGICSIEGANVFSNTNTGSGNNYGVSAKNGGRIARNGTQPSGSSSYETTAGGQVI